MMKGVLKNVEKKENGLKKEESEFKAGAKAVKLLDTLFKEKSDCEKKIDVIEKGSKEDDLKQSMSKLSPKMVSLLHCLHEKGYLKKANFMQLNKFDLSCFSTYYSRTFLQGAAEKFGKDHQELLANGSVFVLQWMVVLWQPSYIQSLWVKQKLILNLVRRGKGDPDISESSSNAKEAVEAALGSSRRFLELEPIPELQVCAEDDWCPFPIQLDSPPFSPPLFEFPELVLKPDIDD